MSPETWGSFDICDCRGGLLKQSIGGCAVLKLWIEWLFVSTACVAKQYSNRTNLQRFQFAHGYNPKLVQPWGGSG